MDADGAGRDRGDHRGAPARSSSCISTWSASAAPTACTCCRHSSTTTASCAPTRSRRGSTGAARPAARGPGRPRLYKPWRTEVVERLAEERMLPAIVFVFSRAGCDQAVEQCLDGGIRLTDAAERVALRRIADAHLEALDDADLDVLGYDSWLAGLEAGVAAHHAGMVPPMKEAVEEAFAAGLLKVVFATETLSLGINMPARSVVVEKLSKFTGEHHELLTPGEYTQLAGRAGRRGIDDVGYAVVLWDPFVAVRSGRRPRVTTHVRAHVVVPRDLQHGGQPRAALRARGGPPPARPVVRAVPRRPRRRVADAPTRAHPRPARARRAPRRSIRAATSRSTARCSPTLDEARRAGARGPGQPARQAPARRRRDGARTRRPRGRARSRSGAARATGCSRSPSSARWCGWAPDDFPGPIRRLANVELPRPFAPRSPSFQRGGRRAVAPAARRRRPPTATPTRASTSSRRACTPIRCTARAGTDVALRGAWQADRIAREVARLERRISGRTETPGPPVRPRARRARVVGLRGRLGAPAERPAALPAQHRM